MRALSCLVGFNAGGRKEYSMFRFSLLTLAALAATAAQGREAPFGSATEQTVRETCGENLKTSVHHSPGRRSARLHLQRQPRAWPP